MKAAILLLALTQPAAYETPEKITCQTVRETVLKYGPQTALLIAHVLGATPDQVLAAKRCLPPRHFPRRAQ